MFGGPVARGPDHARTYSFMTLKPVTSKNDIRLDDADARLAGKTQPRAAIERATAKEIERIAEQQRVLYADARYALLIVLQGRDAAGKDGTIRKVFTAVNPQGCSVYGFKTPTEAERAQDFLWRVHYRVPPRGMIGIFNRSHYEDILVPRVHKLVPQRVWFARYRQINEFERLLSDNNVIILKFLLHISRDEQKRRVKERLTDPSKNWKFRLGDLDDRQLWDDFTKAYSGILRHTSTKWAPWYVVPADDKPVRDWLVAEVIADTMRGLKLRYPPPDPSIIGLEID